MDDPAFNTGKRKREEEGDPVLHLLSIVLRIGDRLRKDTRPVEQELDEVAKRARRDVASRPDQVIQTILDCSVEVSTKCGIYATLVGLWHADEEPIVSDLLSKACDDLNEALASGDCYKARLLLRLLASLTTASVVSIQSFLGTLNTIAAAANQILQEGISANAGSWLQPYTDYLMYTAVIALPWLSPELHNLETDPEGLTEFASAVEQYLSIRPCSLQEALNPFDPTSDSEDAAHLSAGGGASFLPQLWQSIQELKADQWKLAGVPSYAESFQPQLAACNPLDLPQLIIPSQPPGLASGLTPAEAAAAILHAYPPRGGLNLQLSVNKQSVTSLMSAIDRIVAQEYVVDTIHYFDGDNNELARRLGIALPFSGPEESFDLKPLAAIVQETIFAQLLRLPESELGVLAYAKVTTNLCKLSADFAQPIGGCLKALKEGMPQTDPDVALRVAEWLALHINNHDFIWSWHRWESVLELAPYDPTRHFVAWALERTMRLSFREFHLQFDPTLRRERVPEAMLELIGPTPSVKPVFEGPSPTAPSTAPAAMDAASDAQPLANGSAAAADGAADDGAAAVPAAAAPADGAGAEAAAAPADDQQQSAGLEPVPELAAQLFAQVKQIQAAKAGNSRQPVPGGPSLSARLSAWLEENNVKEGLGGELPLLKWLIRCLLTIGGRSIGHLYSYLDRHEPIMNELVQAAGDQGEDVLMSEATSLWASSVQLTSIIVDHLMGKRWVSGAAVLRWLFGPQASGMRSADDAMECLKCTDILHNTVARILARTQDDREILQACEQEMARRQASLQALLPTTPIDEAADGAAPAEDSPAITAARQAVTTFEPQVTEAQQHLQESIEVQNSIMLQVYQGYLSLLAEASLSAAQPAAADGAVPMEEEDSNHAQQQDSQSAWRKRTLAALGAFLRRQYVPLAPIAPQIQQIAQGLLPDVKDVVLRHLDL